LDRSEGARGKAIGELDRTKGERGLKKKNHSYPGGGGRTPLENIAEKRNLPAVKTSHPLKNRPVIHLPEVSKT